MRPILTSAGIAIFPALAASAGGMLPVAVWPTPGSLAIPRAATATGAAIDAESRLRRMGHAIRSARITAGLPLDAGAPADEAGWIGSELTPFVTTLGSLEAKRAAGSPAWARILTAELAGRGVGPGSVVAANFSGSFPALNAAVICAAQALGAKVAAASSVTASTWGATDPGLTWPEMETRLVRLGLIRAASAMVTIGGGGDRGLDLDADARDRATRIGRTAATALGAEWLVPATFDDAVRRRQEAFDRAAGERGIAVFVNVGGSETGLGLSPAILGVPGGWVAALPSGLDATQGGLVERMAARGTPVLHLLNVRELALRWGVR